MRISQVEIIPIRPKRGLIGFATIEIDEQLILHSIGIHRKRDGSGYRLTYPTRGSCPISKAVFYPTNSDLSKEIECCIFKKLTEIFDL